MFNFKISLFLLLFCLTVPVFGIKVATLPDINSPDRILVNKDKIYIIEKATIRIYSSENFKSMNRRGQVIYLPKIFRIDEKLESRSDNGTTMTNNTGCPRMSGEHKVHPYAHPEILCRGESCIRPFRSFYRFFLFSDSLNIPDPTLTLSPLTKKKINIIKMEVKYE